MIACFPLWHRHPRIGTPVCDCIPGAVAAAGPGTLREGDRRAVPCCGAMADSKPARWLGSSVCTQDAYPTSGLRDWVARYQAGKKRRDGASLSAVSETC